MGEEEKDSIDRYFERLASLDRYKKPLAEHHDSDWPTNLFVDYINSGSDPAVLDKALLTAWATESAPPSWLVFEISRHLEPWRHKRPSRGKHSFVEAEAADSRDCRRGMEVFRLRQRGVPEREVYQAAADDLVGTDCEGSDEAIRQSWRRVKDKFPPVG